jgi:predicted ArsR family transcriptional regulator
MAKMTLNAVQLACLASPARNEVLTQLRGMGQGSASEIAKALGKKPEAIHYHLKALVSAGLAFVVFRRPAPKKPESVYEPIGTALQLPPPNAGPEVAALARKAVKAGFAATTRGYLKAAENAEHDPAVRSHMHLIRANLRLSEEDAKTFLELLESANKFASEHRTEEGARLLWSSAVYPPPKSNT